MDTPWLQQLAIDGFELGGDMADAVVGDGHLAIGLPSRGCPGWLLQGVDDLGGEVGTIAVAGIDAVVAEVLATHRRIKRDDGQAQRHVLGDFAAAFAQAHFGSDGYLSQPEVVL